MVWSRITDGISNRLAFFPPSPPSYVLDHHGDGNRELFLNPVQPGLRKVPRAKIHRLQPSNARDGETIVVAYVPNPGPAVRFTLLHSHGNAVDLGQMLPAYQELARLLHVNVIAYDYRGYGESGGEATESATLADVSSVLAFAQKEYGRELNDIILYGQSVGTGPTTWLAARTPGLAGVVLHSPLLSGVQTLKPGWTRWPAFADIFPTYKFVPKIECPTLVMHGTEDAVIGIDQGKKVHNLCKKASQPFWAEGRGHDNVEADPQFIPILVRFMKECFGAEYGQHLP